MTFKSIDRRSGKNPRERQHIPVETISEYFSAERSHREVKRGELGSIFAIFEQTRRERRWWRQVLRAIRGRRLLDFFKVKEQEQAALTAAIAEGVEQGKVVLDRQETGQ